MTSPLAPQRGGFLRPFGAAVFVRDFLAGRGDRYGVRAIDPDVGAPMVDIHQSYKEALHRAIAEDLAVRRAEELAEEEDRAIDPREIEELTGQFLERIPLKLTRMRYASFTAYFRKLKALGWVQETGRTEPSAVQDFHPPAPARVFYRLTGAGRRASTAALSDPITTLYGYDRAQRSPKRRKYMRYEPPSAYRRRRARRLARGAPRG